MARSEWLQAIRRRGLLIVGMAALVTAASLAISLSGRKEFTSTAQLYFNDPGFSQELFGNSVLTPTVDPTIQAATNVQLVTLETVAARAATVLGSGYTARSIQTHISVAEVGISQLVSISATEPHAAQSALVANTFAQQFVEFRQQSDRSSIEQAEQLLAQHIASLPASARNTPLASDLATRQEELQTLSALQTGDAQLVQQAQVPTQQSSPRPLRNAVIGLLLGLVAGFLLAAIAERVDNRVRSVEEFDRILPWNNLGLLPVSRSAINKLTRSGGSPAESIRKALGESLRLLAANLRFAGAGLGAELRTVLVTSAVPGEGKTTVSYGLAATLAAGGKRVLLIEADLRAPTLARILDIPGDPRGLSTLLSGDVDLASAVIRLTAEDASSSEAPQLEVLLAGPTPPNPAQLLQSAALVDLLAEAERTYDITVIDSPPILAVADGLSLVDKVSGVLVVSRVNRTPRDALRSLTRDFDRLSVAVLGAVINGAAEESAYGAYGPYGRYRADADLHTFEPSDASEAPKPLAG